MALRYVVSLEGEELLVDVERRSDGRYRASIVGNTGPANGRTWTLQENSGPDSVTLVSGERVLDLVLAQTDDGLDAYVNGQRFNARVEPARATSGRPRAKQAAEIGAVVAPMPGKVIKVLVRAGDLVEVGAALVVVEAMKMENELHAKAAGRVRTVLVAPGDAVDRGAVLMSIEPW